MSETTRPPLITILRDHLAVLVSALYVAASVIGMLWSWIFPQYFDVDFFDYAQVSDFLLASLKEPFTWVLVFAAVALVMADNALSRRFERKLKTKWLAWYASPRYRSANFLAAVLLVALFIFFYAAEEAKDVKNGEGQRVMVTLADVGTAEGPIFLATTGQFILL